MTSKTRIGYLLCAGVIALVPAHAAAQSASLGSATPIATTGPIVGQSVTLVWTAVADATHYRVRIDDAARSVVDAYYRPDEAGCVDGGVCVVTVSTETWTPGPGQWWVQAWSATAEGAWSAPRAFTYAGALTETAVVTPEAEAGSRSQASRAESHTATTTERTADLTVLPRAVVEAPTNTALGTNSMVRMTSGLFNTALGAAALFYTTTGSSNTGTGYGALHLNVTGSRNTAVGDGALFNQKSPDNTAVGFNALFGATSTAGNTAVGAYAMRHATTGSSNTAVGYASLHLNGGGTDNVAIGKNALFSNTGDKNVAVGTGALQANTLGAGLTAVGYEALHSNLWNGYGNTAIGYRTMKSNTGGDWNTALGWDALANNTHGEGNTALGYRALNTQTSGALGNTAVGFLALVSNTTGDLDTAVGFQALRLNATGARNTAVGGDALSEMTGGSDNVAVGHRALDDVTGGSDSNTALGTGAGGDLLLGNNNLYLDNPGIFIEADTIRIGDTQSRAFIQGISGTGVNGLAVVINSGGQLGTVTSTRRVKQDIAAMGAASQPLMDLRPVTFRYRQSAPDGSQPLQYGLIAEEVAEVMPELVVLGEDGQPISVQYHQLGPLLLNEVQRQRAMLQQERDETQRQADVIHQQQDEMRRQGDAIQHERATRQRQEDVIRRQQVELQIQQDEIQHQRAALAALRVHLAELAGTLRDVDSRTR